MPESKRAVLNVTRQVSISLLDGHVGGITWHLLHLHYLFRLRHLLFWSEVLKWWVSLF